nr:carboxymuconolactone decarboxylase family protein [uncultured Hyphomonas sp.]
MPLLDAWSEFGLYTMRTSQVDPVLREVLVLRTSRNVNCDYEWHHHEHIGRGIGLTEEQIAQIHDGQAMDDEDHNLMVQCADDLSESTELSDKTWSAMVERFGLGYTLDTIFTVGAYTALAMGLKSCRVQVERSAH